MEFWGVEVKPGDSLKVTPDANKLIHISQAALGDVTNGKGADSVPLRLKIDDKNFFLGTLLLESSPQLAFDLVFEKEFELSHDWKNGSVYFCGYTADNPSADGKYDSDSDFSSDENEELPQDTTENGKLEPNVGKAKPGKFEADPVKPKSSTKPKVTLVEPTKDAQSDDDDDDDDDDVETDEDMPEFGSSPDISDSDESDDDELDDEDTPKKAELTKKRSSESAIKTPGPSKKAKSKSNTPQKTDGKKGGGHTATPHPSKQAGKTPVNINISKEKTPKSSGGQVSCKTCMRTFTSESALQSHAKAKHGGK